MTEENGVNENGTSFNLYNIDPLVALKLLWEVIKLVLGNELVNRTLDNFFAKTTNKIDDMVWKLLESALGIAHAARQEYLNDGLAKIQAVYNEAKTDETKIADLKSPLANWWNGLVPPLPVTFGDAPPAEG